MEIDDDGNTRELPSGLVTFVFTDIEGSTRLYKALGEAAAQAVFDTHNEHLRAAWTSHNGYEVHTEGDSFFVVFEDPNDAVAACTDAQQRLHETNWPDGGDVKVRIGIHCGLAAPRHDDYMSLAVHQAARIMSAANGGQLLISDAVMQRLVAVEGQTITRTGSFRLRDFDEAPVLHRVHADGLPITDQPPRATPANHHNLVPRLTSFVGRDADVVTVNELLAPGRAVTLVGLGGMGKTRLATEVGLQVAPTWEHGVWMVELAEVVDPDLIPEEVARAIGVDIASVGDRWNDVVEFIGDKALLLIVDNIEHLIDEWARLAPNLLRSCPNVSVLSTSREPLNCQGEIVYRLQPLELSFETDDPTQLPSVELFIDRARAVSTDVAWTPEAIDEVLEICRHLDGLPLAIEIAAAQVAVLQLTEIREGLNNRFRLLRSRDRALPARQRTMEGLLGWSYRLLNENEQRAFRRLAVFAGSFSIDAAEAALAADDLHHDDVPELIWALVDKSLIAADLSDSATRYRLLESVQQYAMRLLIDNDDAVRSAVGLARWLLSEVAPWHVNDLRWFGDVSIEIANIRTVVELIAEDQPELAQQLMCSVGHYHDSVQSYQAGAETLSWAVDALPHRSQSLVALLATLAHLHLRRGDIQSAKIPLDQARELNKTVGSPSWDEVAVERTEGELAARQGLFAEAAVIAERTLELNISDQAKARMWNLLGIARLSLGDQPAGLDAFRAELAAAQAIKDSSRVVIAHGNVAEAAWRMGDTVATAEHQLASMNEAVALGQNVSIAYSLIMAARLAGRHGGWSKAVELQSYAVEMLEVAGLELYEDDRAAMQQTIQEATEHLGATSVASAQTRGHSLTAIEATERATEVFEREQACSNESHPNTKSQ